MINSQRKKLSSGNSRFKMSHFRLLGIALVFSALLRAGYSQVAQPQITAYPAEVVADGHSTIAITILITDGHGSPVADGTQVLLQTDLGTIQNPLVTTKDGYAHGTLVAGSIAGTVSITAKALSGNAIAATAFATFVKTRADLDSNQANFEFLSKTGITFFPFNSTFYSGAGHQGVEVTAGDAKINAEEIQFTVADQQLHAKKATMEVFGVKRNFSELNLNLFTMQGTGYTTYSVQRVIPLTGYRWPVVLVKKFDEFGHVLIDHSKVVPTSLPYNPADYAIDDQEDAAEHLTAARAVVIPHREIQFQKARLYAGTSKVIDWPLYLVSLQQGNPSLTGQILDVNDNQLSVSYPVFLSLSPGKTSYFRFHMGDRNSLFGGGNSPQMDYEIDWSHGLKSSGSFQLSGLGQHEWGINVNQYWKPDDNTSTSFQLQTPRFNSFFGSASMNHEFPGFSLNLNGSSSKTLVGIQESDSSLTASLSKDPIKLGRAPFMLTYGLTASHFATSAPVPVKTQDNAGLDTRLQILPIRLDPKSTLNGSFDVQKLTGTNTSTGLIFSSELAVGRPITKNLSTYFLYDFTSNSFQSQLLGNHRLTSQITFSQGNISTSLTATKSIGFDNVSSSASLRYRFSNLWHLAYSYSMQHYLGSSYLDYIVSLSYRIAGRDFGLSYSRLTHRLGIVVYGASLY